MNTYYVGLDVHKASICIAVSNASGKLVTESVIETSAATILGFLKELRGEVYVTLEEGTHAAWLSDVLKKLKAQVIVCDPRKNRLLQDGHKSDKVDARKLAQLLRAGLLSPVYHGEHGTRDLKELVRSYEYLVEDSTRVMNRITALYSDRSYYFGSVEERRGVQGRETNQGDGVSRRERRAVVNVCLNGSGAEGLFKQRFEVEYLRAV